MKGSEINIYLVHHKLQHLKIERGAIGFDEKLFF